MSQEKSAVRANLADRARGVGSLRDFLELLEEYGQAITWTDRIMPEPDLRNIAVAASRDVNHAPAILFDNIAGYPGKRTVVGVHGSWDNIALLLGQPKGTTIRDMFFDIAGRWGDASAQISRVSEGQAPVHECRHEENISLYDLLPVVYRERDVSTRDDVVAMLDKIISYYEQHEPSSPVPLLMQRAKRLVTMNFLELMKDLADKGLPQVEAITGKEGK